MQKQPAEEKIYGPSSALYRTANHTYLRRKSKQNERKIQLPEVYNSERHEWRGDFKEVIRHTAFTTT